MASILVVDDEAEIRNVIRVTLEGAGHTVEDAANGAIGLNVLAGASFDLIITDILMPEMEGIETIRTVRKSGCMVPILAITGGGSMDADGLLLAVKHLGATRGLAKPFRHSELLRVVAEMLAATR